MVSIQLSNGEQVKSTQQVGYRFIAIFSCMSLWILTLICQPSYADKELPLDTIKLPPGLK